MNAPDLAGTTPDDDARGAASLAGCIATVFIASAGVMAVEILSTRLVAPYLGASLYTWTSAIAVILAGISAGSFVGGSLADRSDARRCLAWLCIAGAIGCAAIPWLNRVVGTWHPLALLSWPLRVLLHFGCAFLLPAVLLGTLAPVVARLALTPGRQPGRTLGVLYACGSLGSIVGTLVAGFWLIAWCGVERAILLVAGTIALLGVGWGWQWRLRRSIAVVIAACLLVLSGPWSFAAALLVAAGVVEGDDAQVILRQDSRYQRIAVVEATPGVRSLMLDKLVHSKINLAAPLALKYEYEQIYGEVVRQLRPAGAPVRALCLGGGGFVFPRYLELTRPGSSIEVVEINPAVTAVAFAAFGLPRDTTIRCVNGDARQRVAELLRDRALAAGDGCDFIFGDVVNDLSVPFHLTTVEYCRALSALLADDGVYLLNLIDTLASGALLGALLHTCREVFPAVAAFAAHGDPYERNTFVIVAAKRPGDLELVVSGIRAVPALRGMTLSSARVERILAQNDGLVLTDDYAPVERLLAPVLRSFRAPERVSPYEAELRGLIVAGDRTGAIERGQAILAADPAALSVRFLIGAALAESGELEAALIEYQAELAHHPEHALVRLELGRTLEYLGRYDAAQAAYADASRTRAQQRVAKFGMVRMLARLGRRDEAAAALRLAIAARPLYAEEPLALAALLGEQGQLEPARRVLLQAIEHIPDQSTLRVALANLLLSTGDPHSAIAELQTAVQLDDTAAAVHYELGRALSTVGAWDRATQALQRAVDLAPAEPTYQAAMEACRQGSAADRARQR